MLIYPHFIHQVDLEGVFVNGITVSELPNVDGNIYKIQFSPERCQDVTEWDEYRHINGAIRVSFASLFLEYLLGWVTLCGNNDVNSENFARIFAKL